MKTIFTLVAALALTGAGAHVNAQGTKPAAKGTKMETPAEEKTESKKEEARENGSTGKPAHHGAARHHAKMATKRKM